MRQKVVKTIETKQTSIIADDYELWNDIRRDAFPP